MLNHSLVLTQVRLSTLRCAVWIVRAVVVGDLKIRVVETLPFDQDVGARSFQVTGNPLLRIRFVEMDVGDYAVSTTGYRSE